MSPACHHALTLLPILLLAAGGACAASEATAQDIRFAPGAKSAVLKGSIQGRGTARYRVEAAAGQALSVTLKAGRGAQQFTIVSPGSQEALYLSESAGPQGKVRLPIDGSYTIQTFLMRSAARRNERSDYTLAVALTGTALPALPATLDARVAGSAFHATASLRCKPPYGAEITQCEAGVIRRGRDGSATLVLSGPNQLLRQILFVKGQPVASNTALKLSARREGELTVVDIDGQEHYEVPDALLIGG